MSTQVPRNRAERRAAARERRGVAGAMAASKVGAIAAATAVAAFVGGGADPAGAATFTVVNTNDSGAGSLRDAINQANAAPGPDLITFDPSVVGSITLAAQLPTITEALEIRGPGAGVVSVEGTGTERIFALDTGGGASFDAVISGLTLTHDAGTVTGDGGAVLNDSAHLTVQDAVVTGNRVSSDGGGIATLGDAGRLELLRTTVSGNTASGRGGGVRLYGTGAELDVFDSIVTGNHSTYSRGGGLYFYSNTGIVDIARSQITGNVADDDGGGGGWLGGDLAHGSVTDSTVSGNQALGGAGGGLYFLTDGVAIANSTISSNTSVNNGGALYFNANDLGVAIHDSVISGNRATDGSGGGMSFYRTTGALEIVDTTISGNTAEGGGGGGAYFYSQEKLNAGEVTVRNTTIAGNTAAYFGGGLYVSSFGVPFHVFNSTISGNTAGAGSQGFGEGGGINFNGHYGLDLTQDTITNNTGQTFAGLYLIAGRETAAASGKATRHAEAAARRGSKDASDHAAASKERGARQEPGAGVPSAQATRYAADGETNSTATIIAGNAGTDVGPGSTVHSDHSLFGTVSSGTAVDDEGGTLIGADPELEPLADNGGPTETHALLGTSPAIDAGLVVEPPFPGNEFDQRGSPFDRVENGVSDIGAYEAQLEEIIIAPRFTG